MIGHQGFGARRGGVENLEGARRVTPSCRRPCAHDDGERAERAFEVEPGKGVVHGIRIVCREGVDKEGDRGEFSDDVHVDETPGQCGRLVNAADRHHGLVRLAGECHVPGKAFKRLRQEIGPGRHVALVGGCSRSKVGAARRDKIGGCAGIRRRCQAQHRKYREREAAARPGEVHPGLLAVAIRHMLG